MFSPLACFTPIFFSQHLFTALLFYSRKAQSSLIWVVMGEDAHCIPVQPVRWVIDDISPFVRWANLRGPLHSSITVSPPHHLSFFSLSLFSFELYLLIALSPVKGIKGPAPPPASVQNSPIEIYLIAIRMRMTCQMTDSERVSKEYGSYLKPDSLTALLVSGFHKL